uniref:Uncharacterized protein n=1 Tax=Megaselia scalaris TaxID=36166 RepID=T1GH46_MEGSC
IPSASTTSQELDNCCWFQHSNISPRWSSSRCKHYLFTMESTLITGIKVGNTRVTGKCVGINPSTGTEIVFSEDSVEVHVVPIEAIKIRTPLTRIKSGAVMPATIWGSPDLSPMN